LGRVFGEIFARRDGLDRALVVVYFAQQIVQEVGTFKPPVTVKFGVVRRDDDRFDASAPFKMLDLFFAIEQEIARMHRGAFARDGGTIRLLVHRLAGDAMVFETGEFALAVGLDVGPDVVVFEIEADIAIEVTVIASPG